MDYRGGLFIDDLQDCSLSKRNALIRRWIGLHQLPMPPFNQLERIWQEVALARQDADPICRLSANLKFVGTKGHYGLLSVLIV